jgi:prepilin-type N-terminal cleavage/methylation domain-containing protein
MRRYQQGFSLVEVLVAAVILFMVLTASLLIYRSAMSASVGAESALRLSMDVPQARQMITDQMQQGFSNPPRRGQFELGDAAFTWEAALAASGQLTDLEAVEIDETLTGTGSVRVALDRRFYLWDVSMVVTLNRQRREFSFREVTWERAK